MNLKIRDMDRFLDKMEIAFVGTAAMLGLSLIGGASYLLWRLAFSI